jgi:hypothetical protein
MAAGLVRTNEIGRLRVQGGYNEAVALRLRLSQLLGSANLTPPGMAPTAVLIVRQLSDPLPGKLAVRHAATGNRAWEEAARRRLATLYRQAVRPAQGVVPDRATAVYFSDEAEMLACLALALSRGSIGEAWWWRFILQRLPDRRAATLPHLLASQPRLLPAVCHHLASWGQSTAVLQKLTPQQTQTLLTRLARAYNLPPPHSWQQAAATIGQHRSDSVKPGQPFPRVGLASPPWTGWLPAAQLPTYLGLAQRSLLAIALSLHRRPTAVYSQTFWQEMGQWWRAEKQAAGGRPASPARAKAEPNRSPLGPAAAAAEESVSTAVSTLQTAIETSIQADGKQPETRPDSQATALTAAKPDLPDVAPPGASTSSIGAAAAETPPPTRHQTATDLVPAAWPSGILTRIGGIFYLINVMQRLDIPGCYEADWGLAAQVGGWGVLDLLARGLLGSAQAHLADDPVWAALAEIDGRAAGELPAERYSVIAEQYSVSGEQLVASPLLAGLNPALGSWLALALPPVQAYLQQVLQLSDPAEIGPRLLLVNGRLHLSATHIDLVMGLEAIALPVRLAGLDINPGWVPALGRVIQFHFQETLTWISQNQNFATNSTN